MAQAQPAQPAIPAQQVYEQAMQRNELAKLPVWFGDKTKDAFLANDWWERFEGAARTAVWDWNQIQNYFRSALRGNALIWYNSIRKNYVILQIEDLRRHFLDDYGHSATARTSIAHLKVAQEKTQCVRDYRGAVQLMIDQLELSVNPMPVKELDEIFPNPPAAIDVPNVPLLYARTQQAVNYREGYNALYQPLFRNLFIDGLLPHLRDEVIRQNPLTVNDAYALARKAEKEHELKDKINSGSPLTAKQVHEMEANAIRQAKGSKPPFRPKPKQPFPGRPLVTCHYCQKKGHIQKDCYKRQRENGAMKPPPKKSVYEVDGQETQAPADNPGPNHHEDEEDQEVYAYLNSVSALNW